MSEDKRSVLTPLGAAQSFIGAIVLADYWRAPVRMMHPEYRQQLVGRYVDHRLDEGLPADEVWSVVDALSEGDTAHPEWPAFARAHLDRFHAFGGPMEQVVTTGPEGWVDDPVVVVDVSAPADPDRVLWRLLLVNCDGIWRVSNVEEVTAV